MNTILNWSQLAQNVVVTIGIISIIYVIRNYHASLCSQKTQLFLMLRKNYADIHRNLHQAIPSLESGKDQPLPEKPDPSQMAVIQQYWMICFNEWYATTKLYPNDSTGLWRDFYEPAISSSLSNPHLRNGLRLILSDTYSFGAFKSEFKSTLHIMVCKMLEARAGAHVADDPQDPNSLSALSKFLAS